VSPLGTVSRTIQRCLFMLAVVLVGALPATQAHAEPTIAEIEAQINQAWAKLEPLIEEYNKAHSELLKSQKKAAELDAVLTPLRTTVELTRTRMGVIASEYYKSGHTSMINALLSSSPAQLASQLSLLDHMAKEKQAQINETTVAKAKYDVERQALNAVIAEQKKKDDELAARKKTIEVEMDKLQKLRLQAYGSGGSGGGALKIGAACPAVAIGGKGGIAAAFACKQIGKSYVWGANGPSTFDCSGLTQQAWKAAGVSLDHYTGSQWKDGVRVSRANARTGDLVFFYGDVHHVGVYVGNGLMVHAPHTGDVVRMAKIDYMPVTGFVRPG
jgi:cell wall-associated NlpC family hydrolase